MLAVIVASMGAANGVIGEAGEDRVRIARGGEDFGEGANGLEADLGVELGEDVEAILRGQGGAQVIAAQGDGADPPGGVAGQKAMEIPGLVGAVEGPDPDVDDPRGE